MKFSSSRFPYKCMGSAIFELRLLRKVNFQLKKNRSAKVLKLLTSNFASKYLGLFVRDYVFRFFIFRLVFEIKIFENLIFHFFLRNLKNGTKKSISPVIEQNSKIGIHTFFATSSSSGQTRVILGLTTGRILSTVELDKL